MCRQNGNFILERSLYSSKGATNFEVRGVGIAHVYDYAREHAYSQKGCDTNMCRNPCKSEKKTGGTQISLVREAKFINCVGFEVRTGPSRYPI
jgi:hypothetical protein